MNITWKRITTTSLPNLSVLSINGKEVGFITKPKDSSYDKNMWRVFRGIGEHSCFIGHSATKQQAKLTLENVCKLLDIQ